TRYSEASMLAVDSLLAAAIAGTMAIGHPGVRVVYGQFATTNWRRSPQALQVMRMAESILPLKQVGWTPRRSGTTDSVLQLLNLIARTTDFNGHVQVLE